MDSEVYKQFHTNVEKKCIAHALMSERNALLKNHGY
jgi:hypothetical protein